MIAVIEEARRQFELAWALTDLHLGALAEADFPWEPAASCWTVRRDVYGRWRADFADVEPDPVPVPVPTIAWLTWHIDFWWSATIAALQDRPSPGPTEISWPGDGAGAVLRIRTLADQWRNLLADTTIDHMAAPARFPWNPNEGRTVGDTVLWTTVELTKNVAEIGQLRLLRADT